MNALLLALALGQLPETRPVVVAPAETLTVELWGDSTARAVVLIADFPGPEEAASFSLAATAGGAVKTITTTPLLTVEQGISAMHRAAEAGKHYVPPVGTPVHH